MRAASLLPAVALIAIAVTPREMAAQNQSGAREGERISLAGRVVMQDG